MERIASRAKRKLLYPFFFFHILQHVTPEVSKLASMVPKKSFKKYQIYRFIFRFIRGLFPSSNPLSVYEKLFQPLSHHPAQVSRILRDKKSGGRARRLELAQFIGFIKFLERGDGRKKEKRKRKRKRKRKTVEKK